MKNMLESAATKNRGRPGRIGQGSPNRKNAGLYGLIRLPPTWCFLISSLNLIIPL